MSSIWNPIALLAVLIIGTGPAFGQVAVPATEEEATSLNRPGQPAGSTGQSSAHSPSAGQPAAGSQFSDDMPNPKTGNWTSTADYSQPGDPMEVYPHPREGDWGKPPGSLAEEKSKEDMPTPSMETSASRKNDEVKTPAGKDTKSTSKSLKKLEQKVRRVAGLPAKWRVSDYDAKMIANGWGKEYVPPVTDQRGDLDKDDREELEERCLNGLTIVSRNPLIKKPADVTKAQFLTWVALRGPSVMGNPGEAEAFRRIVKKHPDYLPKETRDAWKKLEFTTDGKGKLAGKLADQESGNVSKEKFPRTQDGNKIVEFLKQNKASFAPKKEMFFSDSDDE